MKKTIKVCTNLENKKTADEFSKEILVKEIRENFLYFFISMFKNYEKYLDQQSKTEDEDDNFIDRFDNIKFLKGESDKYDFFRDLFNTRAWYLFLENKIYAKTVEAENQIEFFDSRINLECKSSKKKNKEEKIDFLDVKEGRNYARVDDTIKEHYYDIKSLENNYFTYQNQDEISFESY